MFIGLNSNAPKGPGWQLSDSDIVALGYSGFSLYQVVFFPTAGLISN